MSKEKIIMFLVGFVLLIAIFVSLNFANPDPVTITLEGVLPEGNIDENIYPNCANVTMEDDIGHGELIKIDLDSADENAINWQYS